MKQILFCNIAYMQYYDYSSMKEVPRYGGKYVTDTGDAYEKHNFHECDDGRVRGFVETKYIDGSATAHRPRQLRLESINSAYRNADSIDDVLVVFCAHSDAKKSTVIVGWYKHATVHRGRPNYCGRQYNLECLIEDAYLLPESQRTFIVPRAANSAFGFGQSNTWYAKEANASSFVDSVFAYIDDHCKESYVSDDPLPHSVPDAYKESGVGKRVLVNKYERSQVARRKCIEIHGSHCIICGFSSAATYGEEFANKIEVHHIVPLNEIGCDYKVDPIKDLVPVCPNCHMMLHTKMSTGEYPTIELLKKRLFNTSMQKKT